MYRFPLPPWHPEVSRVGLDREPATTAGKLTFSRVKVARAYRRCPDPHCNGIDTDKSRHECSSGSAWVSIATSGPNSRGMR